MFAIWLAWVRSDERARAFRGRRAQKRVRRRGSESKSGRRLEIGCGSRSESRPTAPLLPAQAYSCVGKGNSMPFAADGPVKEAGSWHAKHMLWVLLGGQPTKVSRATANFHLSDGPLAALPSIQNGHFGDCFQGLGLLNR